MKSKKGISFVIVKEGMQIRRIIEREYGFDTFANMMAIKPITLDRYLQCSKVDEMKASVIVRIKSIMGEKYNVLSVEDQVNNIIDEVDYKISMSVDSKKYVKRLDSLLKYTNDKFILARIEAIKMTLSNEQISDKLIGLSKLMDLVDDDPKAKIVVQREMAYLYYQSLQYEYCKKLCVKIVNNSSATVLDKARAYHLNGNNMFAKGDYDAALKEYALAIEHYSDDDKIANVNNAIGLVSIAQGNSEVARSIFESQLIRYREIGNESMILVTINNAFDAWIEDSKRADEYSSKALKMIGNEVSQTSRFIAIINRVRFNMRYGSEDDAYHVLKSNIKYVKNIESINIKKSIEYLVEDASKATKGARYVELLKSAMIEMLVDAESCQDFIEFEKCNKILTRLLIEAHKRGV